MQRHPLTPFGVGGFFIGKIIWSKMILYMAADLKYKIVSEFYVM